MEQWNQDTIRIDEVSTMEMVEMFNREDQKVAAAVGRCSREISAAIEIIVDRMKSGGRLFYIGSGSGGKLGLLDATECPPTFGIDDNTVIGLISGGMEALAGWREDTEDDEELAVQDLKAKEFGGGDVLVGLSAGGNTPYVLSAVSYAKGLGSKTIGVCCSPSGKLGKLADLGIVIDVGPEVIMGSTRLKGGTAQKMVLNMLSSCSMIQLGKTYHNLMVDVRPINRKLKQRVLDIIMLATGKEEASARQALKEAQGDAKLAILMLTLQVNATIGSALLKKYKGHLKKAIKGEAK